MHRFNVGRIHRKKYYQKCKKKDAEEHLHEILYDRKFLLLYDDIETIKSIHLGNDSIGQAI